MTNLLQRAIGAPRLSNLQVHLFMLIQPARYNVSALLPATMRTPAPKAASIFSSTLASFHTTRTLRNGDDGDVDTSIFRKTGFELYMMSQHGDKWKDHLTRRDARFVENKEMMRRRKGAQMQAEHGDAWQIVARENLAETPEEVEARIRTFLERAQARKKGGSVKRSKVAKEQEGQQGEASEEGSASVQL